MLKPLGLLYFVPEALMHSPSADPSPTLKAHTLTALFPTRFQQPRHFHRVLWLGGITHPGFQEESWLMPVVAA